MFVALLENGGRTVRVIAFLAVRIRNWKKGKEMGGGKVGGGKGVEKKSKVN